MTSPCGHSLPLHIVQRIQSLLGVDDLVSVRTSLQISLLGIFSSYNHLQNMRQAKLSDILYLWVINHICVACNICIRHTCNYMYLILSDTSWCNDYYNAFINIFRVIMKNAMCNSSIHHIIASCEQSCQRHIVGQL